MDGTNNNDNNGNVIFDPSKLQQQGQPQSAQTPPSPQPETAAQSESPQPQQQPAAPDQALQGQVPAQTTQAGEAPPPPPPPHQSLVKKILIGSVIFIVVVFLIFLLLPKNRNVKDVTLTWWGLWEDEQVVQSLIADYRKTHPNVDINYVKRDKRNYRQTLMTRLTNANSTDKPDIFRYHNTWLPMLRDSLIPLSSDVISPDDFQKYYYPVMSDDLLGQNGAGLYGIPMGSDCLALFVNTKLFEAAGIEPPDTWEEFVKAARNPKLTMKDSSGKILTAGAAMGTYGNVSHAPDIVSLLMALEQVNVKKFTGTKRGNALNFYTSFTKGEQNIWDSSLDQSMLAFSSGKLAMYIGFSWDVFEIQKLNKNLQYGIYPLPELPNKTKVTIASYWVEGVSAKSPNKQEAFEFMNFLTKKETLQKFYTSSSKVRAFGEPYPRSDMADLLKDNKLVYPFVSQMPHAKSSYFASDTNDGEGGLNTSLNTYLQKALDSLLYDNASMDTVLGQLDAGVKQVYDKYGISQQ